MNRILKFAAALALAASCFTSYAQEGDKMMKKEGNMDRRQILENHKMMRAKEARKQDKSMKAKLKEGKKMEAKKKD